MYIQVVLFSCFCDRAKLYHCVFQVREAFWSCNLISSPVVLIKVEGFYLKFHLLQYVVSNAFWRQLNYDYVYFLLLLVTLLTSQICFNSFFFVSILSCQKGRDVTRCPRNHARYKRVDCQECIWLRVQHTHSQLFGYELNISTAL